MEKAKKIAPTFEKSTCYEFFQKPFKGINKNKKFRIASWMSLLPPPEMDFACDHSAYSKN